MFQHSFWGLKTWDLKCMSVVRFEVATAVLLKMHIFWDVTPYHWVSNP